MSGTRVDDFMLSTLLLLHTVLVKGSHIKPTKKLKRDPWPKTFVNFTSEGDDSYHD